MAFKSHIRHFISQMRCYARNFELKGVIGRCSTFVSSQRGTEIKVGMIGLGALGTPVALAIDAVGYEVFGYDVDTTKRDNLANRWHPHREENIEPLLENHKIQWCDSIFDVVESADLVFVAIQTPHAPQFEGTMPLQDPSEDFDYSYLVDAIEEIADACAELQKRKIIAVISTCLPGTFEREIEPLLNEYIDYAHTPQFIAMGRVIEDYLLPEFNLIGVQDKAVGMRLEEFFAVINDAPCVVTDVTTAEGAKLAYNCLLGTKIAVANAWGELSERLGMNFDDIYKTWTLSTRRLLSPLYLRAGMSDGGGCHPRDNIAMSWLANKAEMSCDIWGNLMEAREETEAWHAEVAAAASEELGLPLILLGRAFKPETDIETGSPAILMANILRGMGEKFIHVNDLDDLPQAVYFIATDNERYREYPFPEGSLIIDPFGSMPAREGVEIYRLGRH
ncbi:UDPglucose 6-dehydrogenase [Mycolicibacterium sp. BK634]|uniref:NAD(P)-binding domain-containing protein n=1 Tax=Mycolicibacterium sp. BK634 TaxID=2587099 RepID=UPI00160DC87A|nr:NAD(P)-binding domain-containing protein [Mycolicibacterium sp. BK634]MBB3752605.1 UDPglucose 6-dehydrogenase [Mycolicibacterium sp. BK634]